MHTEISAPCKRLFEVFDTRQRIHIEVFLSACPKTIEKAARTGHIPPRWLLVLLYKKNVNPFWLLTGTGPKYLSGPNGEDVAPVEPDV